MVKMGGPRCEARLSRKFAEFTNLGALIFREQSMFFSFQFRAFLKIVKHQIDAYRLMCFFYKAKKNTFHFVSAHVGSNQRNENLCLNIFIKLIISYFIPRLLIVLKLKCYHIIIYIY